METLRLIGVLVLAGLFTFPALADEPLAAAGIMARVAANQDRSERLRSQYVYQQHVHVASRRSSGKILREETADYQVVPKPTGTEKILRRLTGRYWHGGKYVEFAGEPVPSADSTDGELVDSFREDLTEDTSKDGLARDLFPLTTDEQQAYQFRLLGEESFEGRKAYHIAFAPKDTEDMDWAGEAFIDEDEFQPLYVLPSYRDACPSRSAPCSEPTCRAWALRSIIAGKGMASGSPPAWAANSRSAFYSFSAGTCRSPWRTKLSSIPTWKARS